MEISYLGMGIMGSAMAANLARAGFSVVVWNRTPGRSQTKTAVDAGCRLAQGIADAVKNAEIVFSCLSDVPDVEDVLSTASKNALPNALFIDFSTIGPKCAKRMASKLAAQGQRFIDAPVTGGDVGAQNGTLTIMCGGSESDFQQAEPFLKAMGKNVRLCGPNGSGQSMKLCNQVLCAVNMIAVVEALVLADELGVSKQLVVELLQGGAGGSWALSSLGKRIVDQDLAPGFMLKHMLKDLRLIREALGETSSLPGVELAEELFQKALSANDNHAASDSKGATLSGDGASSLGTQAMILAYRK